MKTLNVLNTIMLVIDDKDKTNKYLMATLQYSKTPDATHAP